MIDENEVLIDLLNGPNLISSTSSSSSNESSSNRSTENTTSSSDEEEGEDLILFHLMQYLTSGQKIQRVKNFLDIIDGWSSNEFKANLRLNKSTALKLIGELQSSGFIPLYNFGMTPISSKLSFYLFLWYLANTEPLRTLANLFDVSISSVFRVLRRVIQWILTKLDNVIEWPQGRDVVTTSTKFFLKHGMPHILGAIDCTHINILKPSVNSVDYFDRKKRFSLILQAVVDNDKRFTNIYCGEPESLHDARVLRRSALHLSASNNTAMVFPNNTFLLGDSAYPMKSWLVRPFRNNGRLSRQQLNFNRIHSSARVVVEQAFGALKGFFRRIKFFTEYHQLSFVTNSIVAACILHNYCIDENDEYFLESDDDDDDNNDDDNDDNDDDQVTANCEVIPQNQLIRPKQQNPGIIRRKQLFREMFNEDCED